MTLPRSTIIYNLFPLLAGPFTGWITHLERAASMGFTWVFLNPVQHPGFSGSLYSIKYYFGFNPLLLDESSSLEPAAQFRAAMEEARERGLSMMTDLVINHCAVDSPLIEEHPEWFKWGKSGKIAHPWCMDGGKKVVWGDLASFDHLGTADPEGLFEFFMRIVDHLVGLGFRGFRCDAAYQLPHALWERLIAESRERHGERPPSGLRRAMTR
jgi:starch synthase (maltosyl-transferring)